MLCVYERSRETYTQEFLFYSSFLPGSMDQHLSSLQFIYFFASVDITDPNVRPLRAWFCREHNLTHGIPFTTVST